MRRYRSEHAERWVAFDQRPGDIVVSTRSKSGTTWMQMICLTLIHGTPLPGPLALLSPWIDWDVEPIDVVNARLAAQTHRRVIKTHTPLDGIPLHHDVWYIVVARHPLDVAVSLFHHLGNVDQVRSAELRGGDVKATELPAMPQWLDSWIDDRSDPEVELDTLAGNVHHASDAWQRRGDANVMLVHYSDMLGATEATMRQVADWLGVDVSESRWPSLVKAVSFDSMRADPASTVPDRLGVLREPAAFFRGGVSREGSRLCSPDQRRRYHDRVATLTTPEIAAWLNRP